jgi:hypothetical protein
MCPLNNNGEIGDEFHYLFKCQYFGNQKKIYIKKNIRINPNKIKFKLLITSTSKIEHILHIYNINLTMRVSDEDYPRSVSCALTYVFMNLVQMSNHTN